MKNISIFAIKENKFICKKILLNNKNKKLLNLKKNKNIFKIIMKEIWIKLNYKKKREKKN